MRFLLLLLGGAAVAAVASSPSSSSTGPIVRLQPGVLDPPKPPAFAADGSDLDAAFAAAQQRSIAARKASEDEGRAQLDEDSTKLGEALAFLGPAGVTAAIAAKALYAWGYDWAQKLAHWLYGDPGWNDPDQVDRAKRDAAQTLALAILPPRFDPNVDAGAQGYADRLELDLARVQADVGTNWSQFVAWINANPDDPMLHDAIWLQLFPASLPAYTHGAANAGALGRLIGHAFGRDPQRSQAAAVQASEQVVTDPNLRTQDASGRALAYVVQAALNA